MSTGLVTTANEKNMEHNSHKIGQFQPLKVECKEGKIYCGFMG